MCLLYRPPFEWETSRVKLPILTSGIFRLTWCQFHQRWADFALVDPQSVKKIQLSHQYLLTLLGPTSVKALRRTLMKLSPGVNFINNLWAAFIHHDRADLLCTFGICAYQLHLERWWNWLQETYSLKCNQSLLEQNKVIDWEKLKNFRQGNLTRIVSKENTDACLIDQGNKNKFYWIEWIPLKNVFANKDFFRFFL